MILKLKSIFRLQITMTQRLAQSGESIRELLSSFSGEERVNVQQIKEKLLKVNAQSEQQVRRLNAFLEKEIKLVLTLIMGKGKLDRVGKLIGLLCDVIRQQRESDQKKPAIKQSLAISVVEDVLQCLGINDLKYVLPTITQKICAFKQLQAVDQNSMLRVINHLLKRISKTEDYLIRGQLQFTLTRILPICHDSGFHYRVPPAKGIQIAEDEQDQQYSSGFSAQGITYQFYKEFWQLQKYLMDPNQLSQEHNKTPEIQQTHKKGASNTRPPPLVSLRLKNVQKVLSETLSYMNKHPCSQNQTPLLNHPIKFLTNTHLLQFQLSDQYFREIILVQVLIFTFTLKHLKPSGNILKGVMLTESQRQTINKIQQMAQRYLQSLQKGESSFSNGKSRSENLPLSILETMKCFFQNQLQWLQLKDHWKQKKKAFLRGESVVTESQQKQKEAVDYNKKIAEVHKKIAEQMNIEGDTLLRFLTEPCVPHIVTTPTQTSFACYWPQVKSCLDGFNYQKSQQYQFQTKSQYNMFQWKALRSLYRESIRQISLGQRNPKLREYKALAFVQKKQKQFKEKLAQTLSQNQSPSQQKITNPQAAQENNEIETSEKANQTKKLANNRGQQQKEVLESPHKKLKSQ